MPLDASESALVRILDDTGASFGAVSGAHFTRAGETFTFKAAEVGSLAGSVGPNQWIEVTSRSAKGKPERWRATVEKNDDDVVVLKVTKAGA